MKTAMCTAIVAGLLVLVGCTDPKSGTGGTGKVSTPAKNGDPKIQAALDKLSPEDRALADAQGDCPITNQPLGSMGKPLKVVVNGQSVFVCCKGCVEDATDKPDETLKKVEELKAKRAKS